MSKEVERWDLRIVNRYAGDGTGEIETDATMKAGPHGRYVLHSDYQALLAERDRLREALEQIAAGERIVVRSDGHSEVSEVENDMTIDYPGIAEEALAALQGAQP